MGLRDTVKEWLKEGKDIKAKSPLCSKRLVVENLWEVYGLLEDEKPTKILTEEQLKNLEHGKK